MEEIHDPATPSLLCLENIDMCFDDDWNCNDIDGSPSWDHNNLNFQNLYLINVNHGSEPLMGFLIQGDENVGFLIEKEKEQLPRDDYLKRLRSGDMESGVRKEALDLIWKAHAHHGLGPYSFCLSVNYLDRFLSVHQLQEGKNWTVGFLAVACVSIASKVDGNGLPKPADLLIGEPNFEFDGKSHQKMELMVLSNLKWKMQASTPCSFVDYFLRKMSCEQDPTESTILRSVELILNITKCVDFLEFKPSEIAAAVAISVSRELQEKDLDEALTCLAIVENERVLKCIELMRVLSLVKVPNDLGNNMTTLVAESPVAVLDGSCLRSESDELTVGSDVDSPHDSPNAKRVKRDGSDFGTF